MSEKKEPMIKITPEKTELIGSPVDFIALIVILNEKMDLMFEEHDIPLDWRYLVEKGEEAQRLLNAGMSTEEVKEVVSISKEAFKRP